MEAGHQSVGTQSLCHLCSLQDGDSCASTGVYQEKGYDVLDFKDSYDSTNISGVSYFKGRLIPSI